MMVDLQCQLVIVRSFVRRVTLLAMETVRLPHAMLEVCQLVSKAHHHTRKPKTFVAKVIALLSLGEYLFNHLAANVSVNGQSFVQWFIDECENSIDQTVRRSDYILHCAPNVCAAASWPPQMFLDRLEEVMRTYLGSILVGFNDLLSAPLHGLYALQ
jgi:hypothetical protein